MTAVQPGPRHTTVRELMSSPVLTVAEDATYRSMVDLLSRHRIGALPVLSAAGHVAGIVTEADLLGRHAHPSRRQPWMPTPYTEWSHNGDSARARDIMTSPVTVIEPGAPAAAAARLMERAGVKHLPVVDAGGGLVGMLSRKDVLRMFHRSDDEIRSDVVAAMRPAWLDVDPARVSVDVADGVVTLRGTLDSEAVVEVVGRLVVGVEGVVDVRNRLDCSRGGAPAAQAG